MAVGPDDPTTTISRSYQGDTLVLDTVFETAKGIVTITDFMPIRGEISDLVRIVQCSAATLRMTMDLCLRFDYGRTWPWHTRLDNGNLLAIAGPSLVQLKTDAPWTIDEGRIASAFTLMEDEVRSFTLTYTPSHLSLAGTGSSTGCTGRHACISAGMERTVLGSGIIQGDRTPIADNPEGADLSSDGRHCCRAIDIVAGTDRR
jgi:hypothetical protein